MLNRTALQHIYFSLFDQFQNMLTLYGIVSLLFLKTGWSLYRLKLHQINIYPKIMNYRTKLGGKYYLIEYKTIKWFKCSTTTFQLIYKTLNRHNEIPTHNTRNTYRLYQIITRTVLYSNNFHPSNCGTLQRRFSKIFTP